jgi:thymidylate kinase
MFIVIEGLDGTGKSTTAKTLAKALGGKFLTTPLDKFKAVRPELEVIYGDESLAVVLCLDGGVFIYSSK